MAWGQFELLFLNLVQIYLLLSVKARRELMYLTGSGRRGLKDLGLHVAGQVGIDGHHQQLLDLRTKLSGALHQQLLASLNLLLAYTNVTCTASKQLYPEYC